MKSVWLVGGALALVVGAGIYLWSGQSSDPVAARPAVGGAIVEVVVPELQGVESLGERAFNAKCAECHGQNAAGQNGVAPPLVHKIYEPSHHGDAAFLLAARNGARSHHWKFGDMPPVKGVTDADVATIISYVRALQRANGIN
jgi:mono/diheme cytochrome c family protein